MLYVSKPTSGGNGGIKIKEEQPMSEPKIVFKSDIPEEALDSLAMLFIEEIDKLLESEEGRAEFEKWMREHYKSNNQ